MIDLCRTADPILLDVLSRHPKVARVESAEVTGIEFQTGAWQRQVVASDASVELHGLIELMDNNPLVCADYCSVPPPLSTLALIAFGPLAWAGLIVEPPTLVVSREFADENPADWLSTAGYGDGLSVHVEPQELGSVVAATGMAAIQTPSDWSDIDALYEERFGRSFFVRRDETALWDTAIVAGKPDCVFRMRVTPDEPHSLITVFMLADVQGKLGQAQLVHAMNVMAGFEESIPYTN